MLCLSIIKSKLFRLNIHLYKMRFNLYDSIEICPRGHTLVELSSTGIHELGSKEKTEPSLGDKRPPPAPLLHSPFLLQSTFHPPLPLALLLVAPQDGLGFEVPCLRIQGPRLPHPPGQSVACMCSWLLIHLKVHSRLLITDKTHAIKITGF